MNEPYIRSATLLNPYELGLAVAKIEKSLTFGVQLMPMIVEGLQDDFSLFDYGLFFEGYNKEME
ncbi:MAG: hypothetical protein JJ892_12270 [Balneola sp.]|nr:hypothetical protein [Balneola sp.]MBO6652058.1 hypothetical protein [Balneola sp.]MBO6712463.1 hypothetical protein [Balneola sp.]MBO6801044.1 hypothetical protein [Balneola sp.]MBO6870716.1 hypothetical protein [Balneola sp.]